MKTDSHIELRQGSQSSSQSIIANGGFSRRRRGKTENCDVNRSYVGHGHD